MELIRATLQDIHALLDIEKTAEGKKTYSGYFNEKEIEDWICRDVVYLIKNNGSVVGSISYEVKSATNVYISGLIIKPEFQKQGVAKFAMLELLKELKRFKRLDLVVHPDNIGAIKLYNSLGFETESLKENYFSDGEPRLLMIKIT